MADRIDLITDRTHLETITTRAIDDLVTLARQWLAEDHAACSPRSSAGTSRSSSHGDQTSTIATGRDLDDHEIAPPVDRTKYADRDRLGGLLAGTARRLREEVERRTPRTPTSTCSCCQLETATHGHDATGQPTLCFACNRYLRAHGRHCNVNTLGEPTNKIHAGRPKIRWCACPPTCCDPCPDKADEGRTVSRRCRERKAAGRWNTA